MSCSKNVDDRLSMLPEEIVSHILSLMPTKFAVQTSILSKRWRYKWMLVTNLDFDDIHRFQNLSEIVDQEIHSFHNLSESVDQVIQPFQNLSESVDQVMDFYISPPIQLFRLHFINSLVPESSVSNWIDKAVRLDVRELDIDVILFELPLSMFTCKTLTRLRLNRSICDASDWECPSSVYLPCLKTLEISVYINPFVNAFRLIGGCPMLESLTLEVTCLEEDEPDYIFNIPTLKRLKLTLPYHDSVINKVVLHVPNLEYLFVGGTLCSMFVMDDVSSLVEACVSFNKIRSDHHHLWEELLKGLNGVESLSVQKVPSDLCLLIFLDMEHLELKSFRHSGPVLQFLESCPELKHLYIEEKQAFAWVESKLPPACILTSLTTIKFSMCKHWRYDIPFLEYMLGNAEVLKTITITWKYSSNVEQETRLCAKLLSLRRASRCCEIHFPGNWSHSTSS